MAASAAAILGLSPGYKFQPSDEELVRFFLLPRLSGDPLPIQGLVAEDDPRSAPPWMLLSRNGRTKDEGAFFFAPNEGGKNGRQARSCAGGGTWVTQKLEASGELFFRDGGAGAEDEEMIVEWTKNRLNFHEGSKRSGSTGWVMHEYAIVGASLKICHITFSGHGQKRKRYDAAAADEEAPPQAPAAPSSCYQHNGGEAQVHYNGDQEYFFVDQPPCAYKKQHMSHDEPAAMPHGEAEHSASYGGVSLSVQESLAPTTHDSLLVLGGQESLQSAAAQGDYSLNVKDMEPFQFEDKEQEEFWNSLGSCPAPANDEWEDMLSEYLQM